MGLSWNRKMKDSRRDDIKREKYVHLIDNQMCLALMREIL